MKFCKLQGTGNDFILIDDRENKLLSREKEVSIKLCNRNFAIGADGVIFVRKSNIADCKMEIYNADGSYASMCGNGIRTFAKFVYDFDIVKSNKITIETGDGLKEAFLNLDNYGKTKEVTINMGRYSFNPKDIPASCEDVILNKKIICNEKEYIITSILMGVPHTVIFGKLNEFNIEEGKYIEKHSLFPIGTNVNFCEIVSRDNIKVRTWERGAGATLACGTGVTSCVVVGIENGFLNNKVRVEVLGGELLIEKRGENMYMTGPAEVSFIGETNLIHE